MTINNYARSTNRSDVGPEILFDATDAISINWAYEKVGLRACVNRKVPSPGRWRCWDVVGENKKSNEEWRTIEDIFLAASLAELRELEATLLAELNKQIEDSRKPGRLLGAKELRERFEHVVEPALACRKAELVAEGLKAA